MRLSTKVAYNTIIQIISKVFSIILGLISIAIITRHLGQNGFGQYTTIITFLSFFGIIADLGLTLVTIQIISKPGINQDKALGNLLGLRLVSALIFLGLAPIIVLLFPYSAEVKTGVAIASFSFLFIALNQVLVGLFQKKLRMDKVSIAEIVSRLFLLLGIIIAVKFNYGLQGILAATVFSSLVSFLLHFIFSKKFATIKLKFDLIYWQEIIKKSWPLAITITLNLIYLKSDTLFLSVIPRDSDIGIIAEVGIYGAAYKVIDVLITIPFMFAGIILPIMAKNWLAGKKDVFAAILQKSFDVLVMLALPIAVGVQFVAEDVMVIVAGNDFLASGPILKILIFAAAAIFLGNMFAHAVIAINKQKKVIKAYIFVAITSVIAYLIVIPNFSYMGAAWVTIYSEFAIAMASFWIVWKYTRFIPNFTVFIKSAIACLIMALAMIILNNAGINNLIIIILSAVFVYFASLYFLKVLSKQDVLDLLNK
ncbi:flippase [Candidatus Parcubacteria bacterium]|nr:flippase [Candidatus Parcubacteria bacterium]